MGLSFHCIHSINESRSAPHQNSASVLFFLTLLSFHSFLLFRLSAFSCLFLFLLSLLILSFYLVFPFCYFSSFFLLSLSPLPFYSAFPSCYSILLLLVFQSVVTVHVLFVHSVTSCLSCCCHFILPAHSALARFFCS